MSSRKRRQPEPPASPVTPSKRTRFQEKLPQTPSKTISGQPTCKSGAAGVYAIQGIIDESDDKYLIEWENSTKTTWQPKKNANSAAVQLWDERKLNAIRQNPSARESSAAIPTSADPPNRAEVSSTGVGPGATASAGPYTTKDKLSTAASSPEILSQSTPLTQQTVHLISSSVDISNLPGVAVEVRSPSSFDREAYPFFNSSASKVVSSQGSPGTSRPDPESRFETSSSQVDSSAPVKTQIETVVPDSQSLPQSSSYVPTETTSGESVEAAPKTVLEEFGERSTDIVIPASQASNTWDQRRESEPSLFSKDNHQPSAADTRALSVPQTSSDPDVETSKSRPFITRRRSNHRVIIDSPSPSQASVPEHQPELPLQSIEPIEDITQLQAPVSQSQLPSGEKEDIESSEHSPGLVTQVPRHFSDQTSRPTSESLVEPPQTSGDSSRSASEAWEAGQAYPRVSNSASIISSGNRTPAQLQSLRANDTEKTGQRPSPDKQSSLIESSQAHDIGQTNFVTSGAGQQPHTSSDTQARPLTQDVEDNPAPTTRVSAAPRESHETHSNQLPATIDRHEPPETSAVRAVGDLSREDRTTQSSSEAISASEVLVSQVPATVDSRVLPKAPVIQIVEDRSTPPRTLSTSTEVLGSSGVQAHQLPSSFDSRVPPEPPNRSDITMSDATPSDSISPEARVERMRRALQMQSEESNAEFEAQRAERMKPKVNNTSPPAIRRTDFEVKAKSHDTLQSPKALKSPSLARIAVTPKGPLSPSAISSPRSMMATARTTRSPSRIPEREPYKPQDEPSYIGVDPTQAARDLSSAMAASQRTDDALASREDHQTDEAGSAQPNPAPKPMLQIQNLAIAEYVMPLSMPPRAQKEYINQYRNYIEKIYSFVEGHDVSRETIDELNNLLDRIAKVTTHLDLEGGGPDSQDEVDVIKEADYAASVSAKFKFLDHVLAAARDAWIDIIIVARPGQLCDFIETTLKARSFSYLRVLQQRGQEEVLKGHIKDQHHRQKVILVASDVDRSTYLQTFEKPLIVAFDETFNASSHWIEPIRRLTLRGFMEAPILRLVVYSSLEHINLCLPRTLDPDERLRRLLIHLLQAEASLGQLAFGNVRDSSFNPEHCAKLLIAFARENFSDRKLWKIPLMPPIEGIALQDIDIGPSDVRPGASELPRSDETVQYWPHISRDTTTRESRRKIGEKRPLDLEYGESLEIQNKKMKLGAQSRGADSTVFLDNLQMMKEKERIQELERQLHLAKSNNYELSNPMAWPNRIKVYEDAKRQRHDLQTALAKLEFKSEKATRLVEITQTENTTLKSTIKDLQTQLSTQQTALLNHPDPQIRDTEQLRRRVADLEVETATLKKKLKSTDSDAAYARDLYQKASTAAHSNHTEAEDLQIQLDDAETRLRTLQRHRDNARVAERKAMEPLLKENTALKATLKQRQKEFELCRAELDGLKRGRQGVQTRGSSMQPVGGRSPRGSRGGSPAVGVGVSVPGGQMGGVGMVRGPSGLGTTTGGRLGVGRP